MEVIKRSFSHAAICIVLGCASVASAQTVTLTPIKDNSLFEDATGSLSNGSGQYLFVGRTDQPVGFSLRRALLQFGVAGALPPGAIIDNVELTMNMSRSPLGDASIVYIHRVLSDWGEGASDALGEEGPGIAAATGDATWLHQFYNTALWSNPGGDFDVSASADQIVIGTGFYTWASTPQLVSDVQSWLTDPSSNFGWILVGIESVNKTAQRFDSREHPVPANRPQLQITYHVPVPAASTWGLIAAGLLLLSAGSVLIQRNHAVVPSNRH